MEVQHTLVSQGCRDTPHARQSVCHRATRATGRVPAAQIVVGLTLKETRWVIRARPAAFTVAIQTFTTGGELEGLIAPAIASLQLEVGGRADAPGTYSKGGCVLLGWR